MSLKKLPLALTLVLLPTLVLATIGSRKTTLAAYFDLDGAAASATVIHSADAITDAATFTIDAQPDTPRQLVATLTDADASISACTLTVVGTNAQGASITATATLTGGSGAKALSTAYNWKTVTSSSVGTCTGEGGGDTVSLGTTGNPPTQWFLTYGNITTTTTQGYNEYDPFSWATPNIPLPIKSDSATDTTLESYTASSGALTPVALWDLLLFNIGGGEIYERTVVTDTDVNNVTVNEGIDLSQTGGQRYRYRRQFWGPDAEDGWVGVQGFCGGSVSFIFNVVQLGNDITAVVECELVGSNSVPIQIASTAASMAGSAVTTVDLRTTCYDRCRGGYGWATNDTDGDSGAELEILNLYFVGTYSDK